MSHLNDARDAMATLWDALESQYDSCASVEKVDAFTTEQWETICEAMETIRVDLGLPSPIEVDHGSP